MKTLQWWWGPWLAMIGLCVVVLGMGKDAMGADPPRPSAAAGTTQATARTASGQSQATATSSVPATGKSDKPGQPAHAAADGKAKPAPEPLKLKVFRLKYDEPQSVMIAAQILLSPPSTKTPMVGGLGGLGTLMPGGMPLGGFMGVLGGMPGVGIGSVGGLGGGVGGIGGGQLGALGGVGIQGGQLGALGGIAGNGGGLILGGGQPLTVQGTTAGPTRLVADTTSGALLVRGPERDLKVVADLAALLNTAPGKAFPR